MSQSVVAVICADVHLSHRPPIARSAEPDWYEAMARPLQSIKELMNRYTAPLIICGDIFHHWNEPAELINFAIDNLPKCLAIAGNHDLPNHEYGSLDKSAFGTLVAAGVVKNMMPGVSSFLPDANVWWHAYPYGYEVQPCPRPCEDGIDIAIIHDYCWGNNTGHAKATNDSYVTHWIPKVGTYDRAFFGDNHTPFECKNIFNCGGLIRRRFDEIHQQPRVGLLLEDGSVKSHPLDIAEDKFMVRDSNSPPISNDMEDLFNNLIQIGDKGLDFVEVVETFLRANKVDKEICKIIRRTIDESS